jgi:hypothetical protein
MRKRAGLFLLCIVLASVLIPLGFAMWAHWITSKMSFPYRDAVRSRGSAAYYMQTPEDITAQLCLVMDGIHDLGLIHNDTTSILPWARTYKNSVGYTIDRIESVLGMAEIFMEWRDSAYNGTVSEVLDDVFSKKLSVLRKRTLDISWSTIEQAYQLKYYPAYAYAPIVSIIGVSMFMPMLFLVLNLGHYYIRDSDGNYLNTGSDFDDIKNIFRGEERD